MVLGRKRWLKSMVMIDANVILRYLLNDNEKMASEAEELIKNKMVLVTVEVIAEVIYVLKRVYEVDRNDIRNSLLAFLPEVDVKEREVLELGIKTYAEQNLDFVDCILYAYKRIKGYDIKTFDKKLNKLLKTN